MRTWPPTATPSTPSRRTTRSVSRTRTAAAGPWPARRTCQIGSSYAHLRRTVGEAWTAFEDPIDDETDLVSALRTGAPRRVVHRGGLGHHLRGLAEFAHLGYENSWGKLDRLFLSGTEPTHPSNVAYRGRFDDVTAY